VAVAVALICEPLELLLALAAMEAAVLGRLAPQLQHLELLTKAVAEAVLLMTTPLPISLIQVQAALAL
jgi:hypothetical protein